MPTVLPYGDDPAQVAELWRPAGAGPHPVAVLVHGGFWRAQYDRSLMDALAGDLAARGWAAWNIEYRRVGMPGGGWPGTFADVGTAVDHLAGIAGEHSLDLSRVAVIGHSAGGHLAAFVGSRPGLPADAPGARPRVAVGAVVSQAGVLDLRAAADQAVGVSAVSDLLGGSPREVGDRYAVTSPIERLPLGVPILCVHGIDDRNVPLDQSQRFVDAAVAGGDAAEIVLFAGGHFEVLNPRHESWQAVVDRLPQLVAPR